MFDCKQSNFHTASEIKHLLKSINFLKGPKKMIDFFVIFATLSSWGVLLVGFDLRSTFLLIHVYKNMFSYTFCGMIKSFTVSKVFLLKEKSIQFF